MSQPEHHHRIDYIEISVTDVAEAKRFYGEVFGWPFTDWGDEYASFKDGRLNGGFQQVTEVPKGGALVVLYSTGLEETERRITEAGGTVVRETFEFPGGRRFHFTDPSGNELAVWSDT
jgi:predicted enzyme related to lactoylglutathione lyase